MLPHVALFRAYILLTWQYSYQKPFLYFGHTLVWEPILTINQKLRLLPQRYPNLLHINSKIVVKCRYGVELRDQKYGHAE